MTEIHAETPAEPPTLGEIYWKASKETYWIASDRVVDYPGLPAFTREQMEAGAAGVAAAAIARLGTPAELAAAMTENVRLRKELHERDAQLADALTPTAADLDHAAEIMRLRGLIDELLDCTGLDDGEKAEWLARAGIDLEDE